ncbi:MAG: hypothetical protein GX607_08595 [Myxococcales bacterium]|jgi:hypothetical protein|nr:hypothetical protein [Myxococcales bacterium]
MGRQQHVGTLGERVPRGRWQAVLAEFAGDHKGSPVSIRVVNAHGEARLLDATASSELRLMSMGAEERDGDQVVLLFAHRHPGAEIAHVEFSGAVDLEARGASLSVLANDGCRMEVRVSRGLTAETMSSAEAMPSSRAEPGSARRAAAPASSRSSPH